MHDADCLRHLHDRTPSLNSVTDWPDAIASVRSASNCRRLGNTGGAGGRGHRRQPVGIVHQRPDQPCEPLRVERRLRVHLGPARLGQGGRVGGLVVVERIGIGHQQRRSADHRDLRDRRGAGARHHQMRGGHALRQVLEERRDLGLDAEPGIGRAGGGLVLRPRLLGHAQARALRVAHKRDGGRHRLREELRPLAAAEDQQTERLIAARGHVWRFGRLQHGGPHRIAGNHGLGRVAAALRREEAAGNGIDPRRECPVGTTHDRVLLMDQCRHAAPRCGPQRRQGRVAAEADDRLRSQPRKQRTRLAGAAPDGPHGARQRHRVLRAEGGGRYGVDRLGRKAPGKALGPPVGDQMHGPAARGQSRAPAPRPGTDVLRCRPRPAGWSPSPSTPPAAS